LELQLRGSITAPRKKFGGLRSMSARSGAADLFAGEHAVEVQQKEGSRFEPSTGNTTMLPYVGESLCVALGLSRRLVQRVVNEKSKTGRRNTNVLL
jgi:hypothetical protein